MQTALTCRLTCRYVSALNGGRPFAELSADEQFKTLEEIEGSDFFELVRSTAVVEGPAIRHAGVHTPEFGAVEHARALGLLAPAGRLRARESPPGRSENQKHYAERSRSGPRTCAAESTGLGT